MERKAYPSHLSDDEWAFVAPYLTLMREDAPHLMAHRFITFMVQGA